SSVQLPAISFSVARLGTRFRDSRRRGLVAALIVAVGLGAASADATTIRALPGFTANVLPANDDDSTPLVPLGFTVNSFGLTFTGLYANNNGNITFDFPLPDYTPFDLTSTGQQIIAPFFADVDTTGFGSGAVTYGNDTVGGRPAFGVDWINVGYF